MHLFRSAGARPKHCDGTFQICSYQSVQIGCLLLNRFKKHPTCDCESVSPKLCVRINGGALNMDTKVRKPFPCSCPPWCLWDTRIQEWLWDLPVPQCRGVFSHHPRIGTTTHKKWRFLQLLFQDWHLPLFDSVELVICVSHEESQLFPSSINSFFESPGLSVGKKSLLRLWMFMYNSKWCSHVIFKVIRFLFWWRRHVLEWNNLMYAGPKRSRSLPEWNCSVYLANKRVRNAQPLLHLRPRIPLVRSNQ